MTRISIYFSFPSVELYQCDLMAVFFLQCVICNSACLFVYFFIVGIITTALVWSKLGLQTVFLITDYNRLYIFWVPKCWVFVRNCCTWSVLSNYHIQIRGPTPNNSYSVVAFESRDYFVKCSSSGVPSSLICCRH